jgi:hypothetical protein
MNLEALIMKALRVSSHPALMFEDVVKGVAQQLESDKRARGEIRTTLNELYKMRFPISR